MRKINLYLIIRVVIGGIFLVSGGEKLLSPMANFLYVIEGYDVIPWPLLRELAAVIFPWVEYCLGGFLLLGLWIRPAIVLAGGCTTIFLVIVSQALFRQLPLTECGCFGDLLSVPLPVILMLDSLIAFGLVRLWRQTERAAALSLDNYFTGSKKE
jgi:uncharacterized membrane protein YphA (DoxX/SURF4 family)